MSHLLKYDSIHGVLDKEVYCTFDSIVVDNQKSRFTSEANIEAIPWENVDIVIECTGKFRNKEQLQKHLNEEVEAVILSVPPEDDNIKTVVLGVNDHILTKDGQYHL